MASWNDQSRPTVPAFCQFARLDDPELQGFFPQKTIESNADKLPLEWDILPPGYFWKATDFPYPVEREDVAVRQYKPRKPKPKVAKPQSIKPFPILEAELPKAHRAINIIDYRSTFDVWWYLKERYMTDNQSQLRNLILDFIYRLVCQGKTNQEICRAFESKGFPGMSDDELNKLREEFKFKEQMFPEKMAQFRQKLGV